MERNIGKYAGAGKARRRCGGGRNNRICHGYHIFVIPHQAILNLTIANFLLAAFVYVAYRSQKPDEATVNDVKKELQENNIDASKLAVWPANHCQ